MAKKTIRAKHYIVAEYAMTYYGDDHYCTLCGNTGIVDTRGARAGRLGKAVGRLNWCICPNGQVLRKSMKGENP